MPPKASPVPQYFRERRRDAWHREEFEKSSPGLDFVTEVRKMLHCGDPVLRSRAESVLARKQPRKGVKDVAKAEADTAEMILKLLRQQPLLNTKRSAPKAAPPPPRKCTERSCHCHCASSSNTASSSSPLPPVVHPSPANHLASESVADTDSPTGSTGQVENTNNEPADNDTANHMPGPAISAPDEYHINLPSGSTIEAVMARCNATGTSILQLDDPRIREALDAQDLAHLKSFFPSLPQPDKFFDDCLQACEAVTRKPTSPHGHRFQAPPYEDYADHAVWTYIHNAVCHFGCHYAELVSLGAVQAEVFTDVNIWNYLWDSGFMKSEKLIINRKELHTLQSKQQSASQVGPRTVIFRHDGIIHSRLPYNWDLGFIEVKPLRIHRGSNYMTADREKIIDSMQKALRAYNVPGVHVVGILCEGVKMNILRGTLVDGHVLITETEEYVELSRLLSVIRRCWRIKLALEESYDKLKAAAEPASD